MQRLVKYWKYALEEGIETVHKSSDRKTYYIAKVYYHAHAESAPAAPNKNEENIFNARNTIGN